MNKTAVLLFVCLAFLLLAGCGLEEWQARVWRNDGSIIAQRTAFSEEGCQKHLAVLREKHPAHWGADCRLMNYFGW